jgi:hypothetical protein
MKVYDVLDKLIAASTYDEASKQEMRAAVAEAHSADIDGLSDEEKSVRPAPVNELAGTAPTIFAGGLTDAQLNDIIARAIAKHDADKSAAPPAAEASPTDTTPTVQ